MNALLRSAAIITVALALAACGETFQGTFVGTADILSNDCTFVTGAYNIELKTQISGNQIDMVITRLVSRDTNRTNAGSRILSGVPLRAKFESNKQDFYIDSQGFD